MIEAIIAVAAIVAAATAVACWHAARTNEDNDP